jgi:hypothetical protein
MCHSLTRNNTFLKICKVIVLLLVCVFGAGDKKQEENDTNIVLLFIRLLKMCIVAMSEKTKYVCSGESVNAYE